MHSSTIRRGLVVAVAVALSPLVACTSSSDTGDDAGDRSAEAQLERELEELAAVDEATVETEEFDSEAYRTTVQVTMEPEPSIDEVATTIDLVEQSRDDFADYSGSVALAASEGDARVATGGEAPPSAEVRAAWLAGAAGAAPDASTMVEGDGVTVTTPEPTAVSVQDVSRQLAAAHEELVGAAIRMQTADPYDDEEGAPVLGVSGEADDLERLPILLSTAHLALQSQAPSTRVGEIWAQGPATAPGLSVRLVKTDFRGPSPTVAKHRRELWPVIRTLIDLLMEQSRAFHLTVEAGPANSSGTPFVDVRTDAAHPTYAMADDWRRLVIRYLRRHR